MDITYKDAVINGLFIDSEYRQYGERIHRMLKPWREATSASAATPGTQLDEAAVSKLVDNWKRIFGN